MDPSVNPAFVLFSAVSPFLIAFVKQSGFTRQVNALIALGCYIVIGMAGALLSGEPLTLENALPLITTATVVGSAAYSLVWDNLMTANDGDQSLDDKLTAATSIIR